MKIAVCLDDRDGYCFAGRRLSMDIRQREDLLALAEPGPLWMSTYSAAMFDSLPDFVRLDDDFLHKAEKDDWCFVEREDIAAVARKVTQLAVYRWNRRYPFDRKFPLELFSHSLQPTFTREFPGKSHESITLEVYDL